MTLDMELNKYTIIKYYYTEGINSTITLLNSIDKPTAFDFETASKYNKAERTLALDNLTNNNDNIELYKQAYITGLSYPSETVLTHLGFSNNEQLGYVIILNNDKVKNTVLDFLVNTDILQIWHNAVFDFRHIYYHTNKFPKHYIDTRLFIKTKKNNVNHFLGTTSLKLLMRKHYGEWEKERTEFEIENIYDERLINYTATDVCATYKLYNMIINKE